MNKLIHLSNQKQIKNKSPVPESPVVVQNMNKSGDYDKIKIRSINTNL